VKKGSDLNEGPNLSSKNCLLHARSPLLARSLLCGCVPEVAAAAQLKKILTPVMRQSLFLLAKFLFKI
jgi:hypothetical protein